MAIYNPSFSHQNFRDKSTRYPPFTRSDSAIEEEIWDHLLKEEPSAFHRDDLEVEVNEGQARLTGHVAGEWQRQRAEKIAAEVRGVLDVRNDIRLDPEVRIEVIRALAQNEATAPYLITVKCRWGWIYLGGVVPTQEAAQAVEETAAHTPSVRGILSLPWVIGLPWTETTQPEPIRRAFQPGIGARVNDSQNGGRVTQVILDPCSRLLSHIAVQARGAGDDQPAGRTRSTYLIPVSAIEAANRERVWLNEGEEIQRYPAFEPGRYPLAPDDWQPPFPYKPGTVRWNW